MDGARASWTFRSLPPQVRTVSFGCIIGVGWPHSPGRRGWGYLLGARQGETIRTFGRWLVRILGLPWPAPLRKASYSKTTVHTPRLERGSSTKITSMVDFANKIQEVVSRSDINYRTLAYPHL